MANSGAVGTLCTAETANDLVSSGLVSKLYELIEDKKDDDEIVLQITYAFRQLMLCRPTFDALMQHDQVLFYLVDLLKDKVCGISRAAPPPRRCAPCVPAHAGYCVA